MKKIASLLTFLALVFGTMVAPAASADDASTTAITDISLEATPEPQPTSSTEVSADQQPYFWLTSEGDSFRITNITSKTISQNFTFSLFPNPCSTNASIYVKSDDNTLLIKSPSDKKGIEQYLIPISILPYKTSVIELIPSGELSCSLKSDDSRIFISGIKDINITN